AGKTSFIEQVKQASVDTRFGSIVGKTWGDSVFVKIWDGSFGGTLTSQALQVSTTDETTTRLISEKVVNGSVVSGKTSFVEQVKQATVDTRFGSIAGKTWGDSVFVKTW